MRNLYKSLVALAIIISVSGLCVYAAQYTKFSTKFKKNFKECDRYEETLTSEFEGKTFTTTRKILGWKNGACRYQEIIETQGEKYQLNCNFSGSQVDELYDAMNSKSKETEKYELEVFGEQTDPKTGKTTYAPVSSTTISGNKAYIKWAKYQNNPYFCMPHKL
jgi:hypothetical protein